VYAQIMKTLRLDDGAPVTVRSVKLPRGQLVKFQPHSASFLDIPNHKTAYVIVCCGRGVA